MAETNKNLDTLELLIQAEKTYIDTLDIIDSVKSRILVHIFFFIKT
jgi:hypothetical protein